MFRGKEHYDKPETALARLELESPICSGSLNISKEQTFQIEKQDVNDNFDYSYTGSDWNEKPTMPTNP